MSSTTRPNRCRLTYIYGLTLAGILIFTFTPLVSVSIAYFIADTAGCTLNEATIHPCLVYGRELGSLLYGMALLGWLMIATMPIGAILFIVWLIVLLLHIGYARNLFRRIR